jgi:hemolysin activation/secretion protein
VLGLEVGAQDELFASGSYTRDLGLWFGMLLTLTTEGSSDFRNQRILDGVLTDERRTGGGAHVDVEIQRNLDGHRLSAGGGFRRETVRLQRTDTMAAAPDQVVNLTFADVSFSHVWTRQLGTRAATAQYSPSLRVGLGASATERAYARFRGEAAYHQELNDRASLHFRLHGGKATESTPIFELLSLGGENSVRGFRADDAIGRSYWSLQNEIWVRFLPRLGESKVLMALERNLHIAPFFDVGQVGDAAGANSRAGVRRGAGAGLRFPFRGIVLALDWGYGSGDGALGRGHGRVHFNFLVP